MNREYSPFIRDPPPLPFPQDIATLPTLQDASPKAHPQLRHRRRRGLPRLFVHRMHRLLHSPRRCPTSKRVRSTYPSITTCHPPLTPPSDDVDGSAFCLPPLFGPLIFDNENSDCRDHCANERSQPACPLSSHGPANLTPIPAFLSYLRLSIYMAIVSVAIVLSFHLRKSASEIELRMARPLGAIFWILSVACLGVGMANYISAFLSPRPLPACLLLTQPRHGQQVQPSRGVGPDGLEDSRCMYIP